MSNKIKLEWVLFLRFILSILLGSKPYTFSFQKYTNDSKMRIDESWSLDRDPLRSVKGQQTRKASFKNEWRHILLRRALRALPRRSMRISCALGSSWTGTWCRQLCSPVLSCGTVAPIQTLVWAGILCLHTDTHSRRLQLMNSLFRNKNGPLDWVIPWRWIFYETLAPLPTFSASCCRLCLCCEQAPGIQQFSSFLKKAQLQNPENKQIMNL